MVRYFDKFSIDRLTILSEVEGQIQSDKNSNVPNE